MCVRECNPLKPTSFAFYGFCGRRHYSKSKPTTKQLIFMTRIQTPPKSPQSNAPLVTYID